MCGGGGDTYDINEAERIEKEELTRQKTTNIQPATVVESLMRSEPCLLDRKSVV